MYFEITYAVGSIPFKYRTPYAANAYDAVCCIIKREHIMYPNQEEAFSDYLKIIADMASGKEQKHVSGCTLFMIECKGGKNDG